MVCGESMTINFVFVCVVTDLKRNDNSGRYHLGRLHHFEADPSMVHSDYQLQTLQLHQKADYGVGKFELRIFNIVMTVTMKIVYFFLKITLT